LHGAVSHGNSDVRAIGNMKKNRRKALIRVLERAALGLIVLDVAVYFAAVRPLHSRTTAAESSYHLLLGQMTQRQERVERLEKFQKALPAADAQLTAFLGDHIPPRRHAFSDAAKLIRILTTRSGVQLDNVSYKLTAEKDEPLDRLSLNVTVEGPFANVLKFAHALESARQLILLKSFRFATAQGSAVSLQVGADLFITP